LKKETGTHLASSHQKLFLGFWSSYLICRMRIGPMKVFCLASRHKLWCVGVKIGFNFKIYHQEEMSRSFKSPPYRRMDTPFIIFCASQPSFLFAPSPISELNLKFWQILSDHKFHIIQQLTKSLALLRVCFIQTTSVQFEIATASPPRGTSQLELSSSPDSSVTLIIEPSRPDLPGLPRMEFSVQLRTSRAVGPGDWGRDPARGGPPRAPP
jgi:hypothetical protein